MRLLLLIFFILKTVQCARILGIFFTPSYSHFVLGETIFKELAKRGHEVTVVSTNPQKEPIENYRDVVITSLVDAFTNPKEPINLLDFYYQPAIVSLLQVYGLMNQLVDMSFQDENVQTLIHSNETFDLVILEQFLNEAHFGFMHHFKAPLILVGTTASSLWTNVLTGNPTPYAYVPNLFLNLSPKMNFLERAWNTFTSTFQDIFFRLWVVPLQNAMMHKYFPDTPHISELMHNASLTFLNSHPALGSPVPLLPNMIEIGGFHVEAQKQRKLSDNLKKYLDEAKDGVIYFSMGSNLKSKDLPLEKRQYILNAFAKLKMKVIWKFEEDDLPGKPGNVRIEKWLPQPSVLAHENVKLFITHGGKLSTIESIYHGKPILGIPMMAEQHVNIQEAVYLGYGGFVPYGTLTEDKLTEAIEELLGNPRYAQEAKYRSDVLRNLKVSPLENAISWIEHVIKHKGAPHLQNAGVHLSWYEYMLLDVILAMLIITWIIKKLVARMFSKLFAKYKPKKQKQKIN